MNIKKILNKKSIITLNPSNIKKIIITKQAINFDISHKIMLSVLVTIKIYDFNYILYNESI